MEESGTNIKKGRYETDTTPFSVFTEVLHIHRTDVLNTINSDQYKLLFPQII